MNLPPPRARPCVPWRGRVGNRRRYPRKRAGGDSDDGRWLGAGAGGRVLPIFSPLRLLRRVCAWVGQDVVTRIGGSRSPLFTVGGAAGRWRRGAAAKHPRRAGTCPKIWNSTALPLLSLEKESAPGRYDQRVSARTFLPSKTVDPSAMEGGLTDMQLSFPSPKHPGTWRLGGSWKHLP